MDILDESLLYFGLLIGAMMTGWSLWMLVLYIKKSPEQRKKSSVGLWIILLALLLGLGALGKPMRTVIERILDSHYLSPEPTGMAKAEFPVSIPTFKIPLQK
ncbi:MAG: hypothetical protein RH862_05795 [Leptospiraceae bacterium]